MLTKALLVCSLVLAGVALAVALLGNPFGDSDHDRARALAYGGMLINAYNPGHPCCHVVGAQRVAHSLWRVEIKENIARGYPHPPHYACYTIQLNRFYVHKSASDDVSYGGVGTTVGRCPSR